MSYSVQPNYNQNISNMMNQSVAQQPLMQPMTKLPSEMMTMPQGFGVGGCGTPSQMGGLMGLVNQLIGIVQQLVSIVTGLFGSGAMGAAPSMGSMINPDASIMNGTVAGTGAKEEKKGGGFIDTVKDIWGGVKDIFGFGGDKKEGGSSIWSSVVGFFKDLF